MRYRNRKRPSNIGYDRLEGRQLLAGDVFAAVESGTLVIQGDDQANIIQLTQDSNGDVLLTGSDTTVNGQSQAVTISEQFSRVLIRMGNGADDHHQGAARRHRTCDQVPPIHVGGCGIGCMIAPRSQPTILRGCLG